MRRVLLLLAAISWSCAPKNYAWTNLKSGRAFSGDRWVTIVGDSADFLDVLETELELQGFRVSRTVPEVKTILATKYVINTEGHCFRGLMTPGNLRIEAYEVGSNERLLVATLESTEDCPTAFFHEVVGKISRAWQAPVAPDLDDPALHRKVTDL